MKKLYKIVFAVVFAVVGGAVSDASAVSLSRSPYLQMVSTDAVNIRWRTDSATDSRVRYGTTLGYGSVVDSSTVTTEHEVRITGLSPNTKYYYTVGSSTVELQGDSDNFVRTALPDGDVTPFRVWATGDFGNGTAGQLAVRDAFAAYTATNPASLWLWLGDDAYNSGLDSEYSLNVFAKYPDQFKNIPVYPCLGNHDYANVGYQSASALGTNFAYFNSFSCPMNAEAGGVASNSEKYYSFNYGNVHFVTLDSYGSLNASGSAMYNWLLSDLAANTQRWTIVNWHHPPYSMGTHNSDTETEMVKMRQNIVPLLETYKADLVLCGHSHTYERSFLLQGHYGLENTLTAAMKIDSSNGFAPYYEKSGPNFNGTVYAVVGVSGQGGNVSVKTSWPHAAMYSYNKTLLGSMILDFNGDTLNAKFLTSTGTINDQFEIVKTDDIETGTTTFYNENIAGGGLNVYPNPFSGKAMLSYMLKENSPVNIEIFDMTGARIYESSLASQQKGVYQIEVNDKILHNKTGAFFVKVQTNAGIISKIIERTE